MNTHNNIHLNPYLTYYSFIKQLAMDHRSKYKM